MIRNRVASVILPLFLLAIAGTSSGCGYKAPPFYPKEEVK